MKCHGCSSLMVLDKQETGTSSVTEWHSCPLCGKVRLTSQPDTNISTGMSTGMSTGAQHPRTQTHRNGAAASNAHVRDAAASRATPSSANMGSNNSTRKGTPYFA